MPEPIAICLSDLDVEQDDQRYLRCVALPGGEPGLGLDRVGGVRWMPDGPTAYELWVAGDGRLALQRGPEAPPITVRRSGRSKVAPPGSPVILLDQDLLEVGGRRLRVHVHGVTDEVHEPRPLSGRSLSRMARAAAAAVALGAAVGAGGLAQGSPGIAPEEIQVRSRPPKMAPRYSYCKILSLQKGGKEGNLLLLECTKGPVRKGMYGQVLDPKTGNPIKDGQLVVQKVKGSKVKAKTKLKSLGKANQVRISR